MQLHPSLLSALLPVVLTGCIAIPLPAGQSSPAPASFGPAPTASVCPPGADATAYETRVLSLINDFRARNGMGPVRRSAKLSAVAQAHACDNAARSSFSHEGSDGSDLTIRLGRAGYAFRRAAENAGLGFAGSPDRMMAFCRGPPSTGQTCCWTGYRKPGLA
ncbi:CAP domain-containing protein [Gemmobacter denitrificans]|uniref:CAP domain-containing protein n=1 Tax=Gemmobacter denitrificans TaxID=3123040 RepID=UPI003312F9F4